MNCTAVMTFPTTINHQLDGREKHIDPVFKFAYPQTMHMFDFVNATPNMFHSNTWGYGRPDGTFEKSMMKDYQDEIIDIAGKYILTLKLAVIKKNLKILIFSLCYFYFEKPHTLC